MFYNFHYYYLKYVCHICEFKSKNAKSLVIHLRTCEKKNAERFIVGFIDSKDNETNECT